MKGSLVTSAILHTLVLVGALVSISAPKSFDVADVEALPVDIVPIEEITQIQQGDKKATAREFAAPVPTTRPDIVENAQNVGDNKVDVEAPPTPDKRPDSVEIAAAPEKVEKPTPKVDNETNDIEQIIKEETDTAPATEVAAKAEPPREVTPQPTADAAPEAPAEQETAEEIPLPDSVPVPQAKPKPAPKPKPEEQKKPEPEKAEAQTAKTPDRKLDEKKQETAKSKTSKDSDFNLDSEVAAILNKQAPANGGAKRSTDEAALGGKKTTSGSKLSQSEMDALRGQIQNNWTIIPGIADSADVRIQVKFQLDESGAIVGEPVVTASGGSDSARQVLMGGARRAVLKSSPFKNLPRDKYDAWSEVVVNFDPSDLAL